MWSKINETLQNKNKHFEETFFYEDRKMITDQKTVASKFNNYFVNIAKNILKDIGESNNKFQDYLKYPIETDPMEVSDLLEKINVNKATDIYGIPPKLVKLAAEKIKDNFALIFNYSIEQGREIP